MRPCQSRRFAEELTAPTTLSARGGPGDQEEFRESLADGRAGGPAAFDSQDITFSAHASFGASLCLLSGSERGRLLIRMHVFIVTAQPSVNAVNKAGSQGIETLDGPAELDLQAKTRKFGRKGEKKVCAPPPLQYTAVICRASRFELLSLSHAAALHSAVMPAARLHHSACSLP
ncbi:hypothetical protein L1887_61765 [Cichorium endivia]|nr:hypothetical protein L1887_61765 [Cichorium endivia]